MSEAKNKKNINLILLCAVLLVAVVLAIMLATQRSSLNNQIASLNEELTTSRTSWETIAAEKEELQAQHQRNPDGRTRRRYFLQG